MTNPTDPDHGAELSPGLLALAPVGGKRRPVKVVEHPAFRTSRARPAPSTPSGGRRKAGNGLACVGREDLRRLDEAASAIAIEGDRYPPALEARTGL